MLRMMIAAQPLIGRKGHDGFTRDVSGFATFIMRSMMSTIDPPWHIFSRSALGMIGVHA